MGTPCSKVENTNMTLDQRENLKIYSKKPHICRCLKSFPCGLLKRTTIFKVTSQYFLWWPRQFCLGRGLNTRYQGKRCKSGQSRQMGTHGPWVRQETQWEHGCHITGAGTKVKGVVLRTQKLRGLDPAGLRLSRPGRDHFPSCFWEAQEPRGGNPGSMAQPSGPSQSSPRHEPGLVLRVLTSPGTTWWCWVKGQLPSRLLLMPTTHSLAEVTPVSLGQGLAVFAESGLETGLIWRRDFPKRPLSSRSNEINLCSQQKKEITFIRTFICSVRVRSFTNVGSLITITP